MSREDIIKAIEKAKQLKTESDLGYWQKVSIIENLEKQLKLFEK